MESKNTFLKTICFFITPFFVFNILSQIRLVFFSFRFKVSLIVLVGLLYTSSYAQSNNCKATLVVEDNVYVDSASSQGVSYNMILTNNGNAIDTFILTSINANTISKNPDDSSTSKNVILNTRFLNTNQIEINEISVNPGESIHFFSKQTIPAGTSLSQWSSNQIIATSKNCNSYKTDILLHTYVLNSNND
jgi:hypothetical protein